MSKQKRKTVDRSKVNYPRPDRRQPVDTLKEGLTELNGAGLTELQEAAELNEAVCVEDLLAMRLPLSAHAPLFEIVAEEQITLTELATRLNNGIAGITNKPGTWSQARLSALKAVKPARRLNVQQFLMICRAINHDPVTMIRRISTKGYLQKQPLCRGYNEVINRAVQVAYIAQASPLYGSLYS